MARRRIPRTNRPSLIVLMLLLASVLFVGVAAGQDAGPSPTDYVGKVEVVRQVGAASADTIQGYVFHDVSRNARYERAAAEDGIEGVAVSNGHEVVLTDENGRYELPAYDDMTVFITKPSAYDTPVDEDNVPQFFYHHLPKGSPDLRFGGLPPTGPLPQAVNFPLVEAEDSDQADCAVIGDTQTYSNRELGYLRDGVVTDLIERDDLDQCGALIVGDVAGDDLGLYPRIKEVMSAAEVPVRAVPGNHDLDWDATTDDHSFDTFMREIGPEYYSYDIGNVHFVGLDNVRYPCTPEEDNADGEHGFCDDPANHPTYNGVLGEEQLAWLENDLSLVPEDRLIVIATHIPIVAFVDQYSTKHQTDDARALYALLEERPALSVSGHAQTVENMLAGDRYAGWNQAVGVQELPFTHITAGAASGSWWTGNLDIDGLPEAIQRGGAPPGYLNLAIDGNEVTETWRATRRPEEQQMSLSVSSPFFREWYTVLTNWANEGQEPSAVPPRNLNDLGDPNLLVREDLTRNGGSHLVANVWNGTTDTTVTVQIDDHPAMEAVRTQPANGEGLREGAEYADPYAMLRHLQVTRNSLESTSGNERAQGWEAFRGDTFGPGPAQPLPSWLWADQSAHLWRLPLPADLEEGPHTATVSALDEHGRTYVESMAFEVTDERPPMFFREELFPEGSN